MSSIDKMKLLAGMPIDMPDASCSLYPATLRDIATIGTDTYFKYVNLLTLKSEEISSTSDIKIEPFDFLFYHSSQKEEFKKEFLAALKFFIKEEILLIKEQGILIIGDFAEGRIIASHNFSDLQYIISNQNFIEEDIVKKTGENEAARITREKLEKSRRKIEELKNKKNEDTPLQITDLIGSLAANSSLNIFDIWNISYYAFNDQFKRMRILEQYNTGLQSIMAGADPKKIKLQDWIQHVQ